MSFLYDENWFHKLVHDITKYTEDLMNDPKKGTLEINIWRKKTKTGLSTSYNTSLKGKQYVKEFVSENGII